MPPSTPAVLTTDQWIRTIQLLFQKLFHVMLRFRFLAVNKLHVQISFTEHVVMEICTKKMIKNMCFELSYELYFLIS